MSTKSSELIDLEIKNMKDNHNKKVIEELRGYLAFFKERVNDLESKNNGYRIGYLKKCLYDFYKSFQSYLDDKSKEEEL